jgi:hypothetical protein
MQILRGKETVTEGKSTNKESQGLEEETAAILQEEMPVTARTSKQPIYGYQYS